MKKLILILTLAAFALMTTAPQVEAAPANEGSAVQAKTPNSKEAPKKGKKAKKAKKKGKRKTFAK